jgi:serine/threonine protein kinase/Tfp pilus assembly protein PilF
MADLTGATLGKYQILERLGRGGMADVYRAYQPGMDRYVAIKVMHAHLSEDPGFLTRFKREAQAVGALRHPHIVQVIDFDSHDNEYYMVMEYVEGESLKMALTMRGALPVPEALAMMGKITDAVAYAHGMGMIHRDLKPANILLTKNSEPILTDFGIAKILSATNLTTTGMAIGTPTYMSPEAGRGEKVDERSDIYSLGVMFYEMVTGTLPYDADTPWAVILKHINEPLPLPSAIMPGLPTSVERILLKSLAKSPAERYQSAAELRAALQEAQATAATKIAASASPDAKGAKQRVAPPSPPQASDAVPTQPGRPTHPTPDPRRRRPWGKILFALVTVLLIVVAFVEFVLNERLINTPPEARTQTALAILPTSTSTDAPPPPTATPTPAPATPTEVATEDAAQTPIESSTEVADVAAETQYLELSEQVWRLVTEGNQDEALAILEQPLADDSNNYYLKMLQAFVRTYYRDDAEKLQQAKETAEQGVNDHPDRAEAYFVLALYWGRSPFDDHAQAVQYMDQALERGYQTFGFAFWYRAGQKRRAGTDPASVFPDYDRAIELEPENPDYVWERGTLHLDVWNLPAAEADFKRSLALHDHTYHHAELAWVMWMQDKRAEAFELYRKTIEDDLVSDVWYLTDGAILAWHSDENEQAEKWSTDAQAIDPKYIPTRYALALVAWRKGDHNTALKYFDEIAAGENPNAYQEASFLVWYRFGRALPADRGYVLIALGRVDEAIESLKLNVQEFPDMIDPYLTLATLYKEKGDIEAARGILQEALQYASAQRDADLREKVLSLLRELGQ